MSRMFTNRYILISITVISWGVYNVILKAISERISWQLSMLLFVMGYAIAITAYLLFYFSFWKNDLLLFRPTLLYPLIAGVFCALGAITFFKALSLTPGSIIVPIAGLHVLVASIGCVLLLKEPFSLRLLAGTICAVIAIVLLEK